MTTPTPRDWLLDVKERCSEATMAAALPCSRCGGRELWCDDCHGEAGLPDPVLVRALSLLEKADQVAIWLDILFDDIRDYQHERELEGERWYWPRDADLTQLNLRQKLAAYLAARHGGKETP